MKEEEKSTLMVLSFFGVVVLLVLCNIITEFKIIDIAYLVAIIVFMIRFVIIRRSE